MNEFLNLAVADSFINMSGQATPPSEEMWEIILQQRKELQATGKELDEFRYHLKDQQEVFSFSVYNMVLAA